MTPHLSTRTAGIVLVLAGIECLLMALMVKNPVSGIALGVLAICLPAMGGLLLADR